MPKTSAPGAFVMFERVVVKLYDGGVLSPAVLERVIGVFAQAGVDWSEEPGERSVDGRSLHEIVVLIMMPGQSLRSAADLFAKVVAHVEEVASASASASASARPAAKTRAGSKRGNEDANAEHKEDADNEDSGELLAQLSGATRSDKRRRAKQDAEPATAAKGFNPFLNAAPPRSKKS